VLACEKRRIVVMLRWALLIALCFLVIYSRGASIQAIASSVVLLLASNLVLMHLPDRVIEARLFDPVLVIVDTILITAGLWLCGAAGADFFFLFFFVGFLSPIRERPQLTAPGARPAAAGHLLLLYRGPLWGPALLLRGPGTVEGPGRRGPRGVGARPKCAGPTSRGPPRAGPRCRPRAGRSPRRTSS